MIGMTKKKIATAVITPFLNRFAFVEKRSAQPVLERFLPPL
jgi:hypothetical protein